MPQINSGVFERKSVSSGPLVLTIEPLKSMSLSETRNWIRMIAEMLKGFNITIINPN